MINDYFEISQEELQKKDILGSIIICRDCNKLHPVGNATNENGMEDCILQFYQCPESEEIYLVGIGGKDISRENNEDGNNNFI